MKMITRTVIAIAIVVVTFIVGARMGAETALNASSIYDASVAVHRLRMIDNENIEGLKQFLKTDVDVGFTNYVQTRNSQLNVLVPELTKSNAEAVSNTITYLKQHPLNQPDEKLLGDMGKNAESYSREHREAVAYINENGK